MEQHDFRVDAGGRRCHRTAERGDDKTLRRGCDNAGLLAAALPERHCYDLAMDILEAGLLQFAFGPGGSACLGLSRGETLADRGRQRLKEAPAPRVLERLVAQLPGD